MNIPILNPARHFECPNCDLKETSYQLGQISVFHTCAGLKGMTSPMVPVGTKCKIEAVEREDYVGKEDVRLDDDGRAIMSVVTTRDDGQDCAVMAPTAGMKGAVNT